jgi:hypothetical protein
LRTFIESNRGEKMKKNDQKNHSKEIEKKTKGERGRRKGSSEKWSQGPLLSQGPKGAPKGPH